VRVGVGLVANLCPRWTSTIKKQYALLGALIFHLATASHTPFILHGFGEM